MARLEVNPQSPLQRFKRQVEAGRTSRRGQLLQGRDDASTRFSEQYKKFNETLNQSFERSRENSRNDVLQRLIEARRDQSGLQGSQTSLQSMLAGLQGVTPALGQSPINPLTGSPVGNYGQGGQGYTIVNGKVQSSDPDEAWILGHESYGGDPTADNPNSTAFGVGQLLIANRRKYGEQLGFDPNTTDPHEQMAMFRAYVNDRYGSMANARRFWEANGWY